MCLVKSDETLKSLVRELNEELKANHVIGEICLVKDRIMFLLFKEELTEDDVQQIFKPKDIMFNAIDKITSKHGLCRCWLIDNIKRLLEIESPSTQFVMFDNLIIRSASKEYMLSMKFMSAKIDLKNDREDLVFLIDELGIKSFEEVEEIYLKYHSESLYRRMYKYFVLGLMMEIFNQKGIVY